MGIEEYSILNVLVKCPLYINSEQTIFEIECVTITCNYDGLEGRECIVAYYGERLVHALRTEPSQFLRSKPAKRLLVTTI